RIRKNIEINGKQFWTLFDTGSRNTYVIKAVSEGFNITQISKSGKVALGGKEHLLNKGFFLQAKVDGYSVEMDSYILEEIGRDEDGKLIEVLFGALAMQKWGIRPVPDEERLDMTHYSKEFVEF
ncbi:MAG: hypothetical protein HY738_22440, partial [Bacteroidia bacterium]|nr:hypothetical protein [Bacteroidia bacterium]